MTDDRDPRPMRPSGAREQRAARILDAAAELLLRHGYQRVTMDDIASQTEVGKGTIYLHWRTKEALFGALMQREVAAGWRALLERARTDAREVLFHRALRSMLLLQKQRPLARALLIRDRELLGKLLRSRSHELLHAQHESVEVEWLGWMRARGLLRTDLELEAQGHAIRATVKGFLHAESEANGLHGPPLEVRADALAYTIHHAFEPAELPAGAALQAIADEMIARLERLCAVYERDLHEPRQA